MPEFDDIPELGLRIVETFFVAQRLLLTREILKFIYKIFFTNFEYVNLETNPETRIRYPIKNLSLICSYQISML